MSEIYKKVRVASYLATLGAKTATCVALLAGAVGCSSDAPSTPPTSASVAGTGTSGTSDVTATAGASSLGNSGTGGAAASAGNAGSDATASGGSAGAAGSGGSDPNGGGTTSAGTGGSGGGAAVACNLAHTKGVAQLSLISGGVMRKVRLFVPGAYDGQTRLPLLLNLHGSSDMADSFAASSQMEKVAESEGFIVAGLEAVAGQWNVPPADQLPDDVKYASDAIELASNSVCVDAARVYASGFSGGGRMSSQLGCKLPDKITAVGPVAGVRFPAPCAGRAVPVIAIHGLADTTNAYAGEGPTHPRWNESVEDAVLGWATKDGCNLTRQVDDPTGPLSSYTYGQCQDGATVKLIRMDGVEHGYPTGTPLHAAKEVWSFLKAYARR